MTNKTVHVSLFCDETEIKNLSNKIIKHLNTKRFNNKIKEKSVIFQMCMFSEGSRRDCLKINC